MLLQSYQTVLYDGEGRQVKQQLVFGVACIVLRTCGDGLCGRALWSLITGRNYVSMNPRDSH